jgi:CRP-like cAMP-binding protein
MKIRNDAPTQALWKAGLCCECARDALAGYDLEASFRTFARDTVLFEEGDSADRLHVLVAGRVELSSLGNDGEAAIVDLVRPTQPLMLSSVILDEPYVVQACAVDEIRVLEMPGNVLRQLVEENVAVGAAVSKALALENRSVLQQLKMLKMDRSLQRFCRYLLSLRHDGSNLEHIKLPFSKRSIAGLLGMTPATLSRLLFDLRTLGVEVNGNELTIEDRARLNAVLETPDGKSPGRLAG